MKIKNNFLVISNYHNEINWVAEYTQNYIIYDQSIGKIDYPPNLDLKKIIKSKHLGHNIRDYCTFIIDNYDSLPKCTIFATGNIFPRHVSQKCFNRLMNNRYFTPIEDLKRYKPRWPTCFFSSDGGYCEINNSWYFKCGHPIKYFNSYNDFLKFCFKDPVIPRYIRFAPGANYIVPRENILKLPKIFYQNLKKFVSYKQSDIPVESYIIERAFHTLWNCNFELNDKMLKSIDENFKIKPIPNFKTSLIKKIKRKIVYYVIRYLDN